ncbi:uncharacterized protein LOC127861711 [Dreissena polymorpha]|uniref:uncharacterized protein LOC127861711 n=1 Tax=Dreissena polymorpha TaxID=45954 RepID=UPI002264F645|nr:uncharacterized protein LOC127861711 [Dreissena polymorpha]
MTSKAREILFLSTYITLALLLRYAYSREVFTNCGGEFDKPQGILQTTNFPGPFPTPISCEWLIRAPPNKKIILYFTEFYMKDSVFVSSYDAYKSPTLHLNRDDIGEILWNYDLSIPLETRKPCLLLRLEVNFIGNRNLRVIEHLLDVFGFNITYEIVDPLVTAQLGCSLKHCSYLGKCIASADYSSFSCQCYDKFFGDQCQYGPHCDPDHGTNLCLNGGRCSYFFGSLINQCECSPGFEGDYCEIPTGQSANTTAVTLPAPKQALARVYRKHNISVRMRRHSTLRRFLVHPKDKTLTEEVCGCVYKIPCKNCETVYIDETGRKLELYISEFVNTDNSNKHMTLRGKMLTLVCAAKGSNGIRFEWYKDDARLDTSLTLRNAWETVIQDQVHNLHLANLNLDVVFPIDQGVFTCKAIDFDEVQTKTLKVTVNNYPQVQLDPMSISVQHGEALTIYCMSPDDSWLLFKYEWYKNGIKIDTNARLEYTEDMYPTGLLLAVTKATKTAEYTCKVTNEAGAASATAYLFVVPRNAKRDCKCDSVTRICKWEKPNFSKCQSLMLIYLHDEVLLLKNGYQKNNITKIFDDLYNFALTKRNVTFYSGDIDMVAGILEELISHMLSFPQLNSGDNKIEALRVAEVIGAILHRASTATPDEKRDIMAGPSTIATINILISGAINLMMYDNLQHISYNDLIDDVTEQVYSVTTNFLADLLLYRDEAMRNESSFWLNIDMKRFYVFLILTLIELAIRHSCCIKFRRGSNVKVQEGGSQSKAFRTYMKPELVSRVVNPEEYNVSRYYDEVNRTKYTAQRKRELSALLGSSDTNSITMDTRSTSISGSDGSKESTAPSLKIDFSFSVRRDSVFETINDSNGERRSIGASGSVKDDVVSARGCFRLRNDSAAHSGAGKNENNGDESNDLHGCVNGHAAMCNNDDLANLSQIPFSDRNMVQNPLYKRINTDKLVSEELKHLTQNPGQLQYDDIYPLSNNRVSNLPLKRAIPDIPDKNCNLSSTRSPTKAFNPLMNYISERGNVEHSSVVPTKANDTDDDMLFNNKTDQDDDYESPRSSN